mgnify:CR=1 FL=1
MTGPPKLKLPAPNGLQVCWLTSAAALDAADEELVTWAAAPLQATMPPSLRRAEFALMRSRMYSSRSDGDTCVYVTPTLDQYGMTGAHAPPVEVDMPFAEISVDLTIREALEQFASRQSADRAIAWGATPHAASTALGVPPASSLSDRVQKLADRLGSEDTPLIKDPLTMEVATRLRVALRSTGGHPRAVRASSVESGRLNKLDLTQSGPESADYLLYSMLVRLLLRLPLGAR